MLKNWSKELSIGNANLGRQHERLFRLSQKAHEMAGLPSVTSEEYHELLNDIAAALRMHFASEEKILARNNCPTLAEHKSAHQTYEEKFIQILYEAALGELDKGVLLDTLSDYLNNHATEMDMP